MPFSEALMKTDAEEVVLLRRAPEAVQVDSMRAAEQRLGEPLLVAAGDWEALVLLRENR
jgi:hypothetical protein